MEMEQQNWKKILPDSRTFMSTERDLEQRNIHVGLEMETVNIFVSQLEIDKESVSVQLDSEPTEKLLVKLTNHLLSSLP